MCMSRVVQAVEVQDSDGVGRLDLHISTHLAAFGFGMWATHDTSTAAEQTTLNMSHTMHTIDHSQHTGCSVLVIVLRTLHPVR